MINVSQKCQYALRAVFELASRYGQQPAPVAEIARLQAIPARFLELILNQLRRAGFVRSRRGAHGGYSLGVSPRALTVGQIIRFADGPLAPVRCVAAKAGGACPLREDCAFLGMWNRAKDALAEVVDNTTFQDLLDEQEATARQYVPRYCI